MLSPDLLYNPAFPRSNAYDAGFVLDGNMGPHPLWLAEWLLEALERDPDALGPEARVLDLGSGMATSSVFWARETGAHVYAADLWTSVDDVWRRIEQAGQATRVTPIKAEAHALPFAQGFFDAIVSVDSYTYYGADLMYLFYLARFLRPGGRVAIAIPCLVADFEGGRVPAHLLAPQENGAVFWEPECISFRTPAWWRSVFEGCPGVEDVRVDTMPEGWRHWRDYERAAAAAGKNPFPSVAETLDRDQGRTLGFVRILARRTTRSAVNLYDPDLAGKVLGR